MSTFSNIYNEKPIDEPLGAFNDILIPVQTTNLPAHWRYEL